MPSRRTNNFPESWRGLGHVTTTIFGSTVGYPSDSLASCILILYDQLSRTVGQQSFDPRDLDLWPSVLQCLACTKYQAKTSYAFPFDSYGKLFHRNLKVRPILTPKLVCQLRATWARAHCELLELCLLQLHGSASGTASLTERIRKCWMQDDRHDMWPPGLTADCNTECNAVSAGIKWNWVTGWS